MRNLPTSNSPDLPQAAQPGEVCGGPSTTHQMFRRGEGVHYEDQDKTTGGELLIRWGST